MAEATYISPNCGAIQMIDVQASYALSQRMAKSAVDHHPGRGEHRFLRERRQAVARSCPISLKQSNAVQLCLSVLKGGAPPSEEVLARRQDDDVQKLDTRMTDIALQVILPAEIKYRENALHQHPWRIKRKAELKEEGCKTNLKPNAPRKNSRSASNRAG